MTQEALTAVQQLPIFAWGGASWPHYRALDCSFGAVHADHAYYQATGVHHQHTRDNPISLSLELLFYNSLQPDSFPGAYYDWIELLRTGEPRQLVNPLLGEYQAIIKGQVQCNLQGNKPSGGTITVSFESDLSDPDEPRIPTPIDLDMPTVAASVDQQLDEGGFPLPPTGGEQETMSDIFTELNTLRFTVDQELLGSAERARGIVQQVAAQVQAANDHAFYGLLDELSQLYEAATVLAEKAGVSRPTRVVTTQNATTLFEFAERKGNTLQEIIELNVDALVSPVVKRGTRLAYYT